jgi:anti-sigma factor RsiW
MTCENALPLIDMETPSSELAEHLDSCPDCRKLQEEIMELRTIVREQAPYYRAPAALRKRITAQSRGPKPIPWNWLAIAASVLLLASIAGNIALLRSHVSPQDVLASNLIASHIRSLAGTHLIDVPSSDRHTVKPWFNGKLDFSPDVKDLASDGFPLAGGRLEYFDGHAAAALVFERRKHIINLFTWPAPSPEAQTESTSNGYHLICWTQAGMKYCAVSDVNETELRQFAELYQK